MAGGVAHEINNPLAILQGLLSLLSRATVEPELDRIRIQNLSELGVKTVQRIAGIVKSLRLISREGSHDPLERCDLNDLLDSTLDLCRERLKNNGIRLDVELFPEPANVECRTVQISQVLMNLLNNAFDAIEGVQEPWIKVVVSRDAEQARHRIRVENAGPRISEEVAKRAFDPFFTTKEPGKGTGLGLSISASIVREHDGELYIDPACTHTCFVLELREHPPSPA